ncbi:flagellar biosynthesis protein FliC [Pseudomaricurvus alcaniphilus]|uniref:flagellin N-terminal helical domain-containing protein n=1 Tax=Pseudomaricurvus alcaniphilus TaxID=1166482 RepID=UPI00140CFE37|nr:flagellin [Pseudomaricurvus alcaniphilus]NHN39447.1 flagellar biosynthesis protein FliC [Pseudomaricurvus alcaniphilus]
MPLVINSNIPSLSSQRQLVNSAMDQEKAMERLSSGKRINTAADDAAGLAIANRMTSQISGLNRAVANANDGVSLLQTAEGALDETTSILQRMRELSIQSANGIYSDADRTTLDAEVQQLKEEIDRIAETTTFNGKSLLDGSRGKIDLQVGSEANQLISLELGSTKASTLGGAGGDIIGEAAANGLADITGLDAAADITINGIDSSAYSGATTLQEALDLMNADFNAVGVEVGALVSFSASGVGDGQLVAGTDVLTINVIDANGNSSEYNITGTNNMDALIAKINKETAVEASLNEYGKLTLTQDNVLSISVSEANGASAGDAAGFQSAGTNVTQNFSLVLSSTNGDPITIEAGTITTAQSDALGIMLTDDQGNLQGRAVTGTADVNEGDLIINGVEIGAFAGGTAAATTLANAIEAINKVSGETGVVAYDNGSTSLALRAASGEPISIEYGEAATAAAVEAAFGLSEQNASGSAGSIASISIGTQSGAQAAIGVIDGALEQINATRSDIGAISNRLDHTVSNLLNISENTSAARSRIVDADFAAETANLSRAQVLQQASQAMLAQANAAPQQVLSLLR